MRRSRCLSTTLPLSSSSPKLFRNILPVSLEYDLSDLTESNTCTRQSVLPPCLPHSIKSTKLTCVFRTTYCSLSFSDVEHKEMVEIYPYATLTTSRRRLNADCTTQSGPSYKVILGSKPKRQLRPHRILEPVPGIRTILVAAPPTLISPKTREGVRR